MANLAVLNKIIGSAVSMLGFEFVGCEWHPMGRRGLIRVYIDTPAGATIDDCERASRQISAVMDVEDPISSGYTLEVSTPGLNRPLFTVAHYQKFLGNKVRLRLRFMQEGRRNFEGELLTANESEVTLQGENGEKWVFPFDAIEKANLVPQYIEKPKRGHRNE